MSENPIRSWRALFPIWIKYCGVCDEYASLKSKWNYMSSIEGLVALPNFADTFSRIDHLITETNDRFLPMFNRTQLDQINEHQATYTEVRLNELQGRFWSLSHYLGILKFVYFQRTVSFEIPEIVSGLPASPERTIGNEAIYLAADKVTRRFIECINIDPKLKWDGAVSFVYPIQESYFFGGLSMPDRYLSHFHISLSEEGKHFLGSFMILAHEISHATQFKINKDKLIPNWFVAIWRKMAGFQRICFGEAVKAMRDACHGCNVYDCYLVPLLYDSDFSASELQQCLADLLAFIVGGPMTLFALIDLALNSANFGRYFQLRPAFIRGYCSNARISRYQSALTTELMNMKSGWDNYLPILAPNCPYLASDTTPCYELLLRIGENSGRAFSEGEKIVINELKTELPVEQVIYPREVNSLTSALVKEKFEISQNTEEKICNELEEKRTCPTEDPRDILHCYYKLFREGIPPDYATTLCSLAYNTFEEKRKGF